MFQRLSLTAALVLAGLGATAQTSQDDKVAALYEALALPAILEVMRDEGLVYGDQIGMELFPGRVNDDWADIVSAVYDVDGMEALVADELSVALGDADLDPMLAFFTSEPGRTIVSLEVSARRALLDTAVEDASKEMAAIAVMDETPRYVLVKEFIEVNDLIETNVVGAMNSNFAFYVGLMDGGAFIGQDLNEEQMLTDVWNQEADIRSSTTEWVYSYLLMAYQPVSDDDLAAYIAFSQTDAGQQMNTALFAAFDALFAGVSRDLGLASAQFMSGQEL